MHLRGDSVRIIAAITDDRGVEWILPLTLQIGASRAPYGKPEIHLLIFVDPGDLKTMVVVLKDRPVNAIEIQQRSAAISEVLNLLRRERSGVTAQLPLLG